MDYKKTLLHSPVQVDGVYTVHYFEYAKDFAHSGELHDFWELVYADKQSVIVTAGAQELVLPTGHLYLHKPNEFHSIRCDGVKAANSVILSFDCSCPELMNIAGMSIACTAEERALLSQIIKEAQQAFATPLGLAYIRSMRKAEDSVFGCEQLVRLYLEQLLILLVRGNRRTEPLPKTENSALLAQVCDYLERNVECALRFQDIRRHFNVSASVLKKTFRDQMGCGVMEYFTRLKVDAAKKMIRESDLNFSEIAAQLSFNTSQYFTTVFHRITGMTPTEYTRSVRSK